MKKLLSIASLLILFGCNNANGEPDGSLTFYFFLFLAAFLFLGYVGSKKTEIRKKEAIASNETFNMQCKEILDKNNFISQNIVFMPPTSVLAISDDKQSIAYINSKKEINIIPKNQVFSCELTINNSTTVAATSKAPIASWNTIAKTQSTMTNTFQNARLKIIIDDISNPLIELIFTDLALANKIEALIKLVINKP